MTDGIRPRPVGVSVVLIVATITAGLALRLIPSGLPYGVIKYGGSILWAMMIYWIWSSIRPQWHPVWSALIAGIVALTVELFKLYHSPSTDAFRLTLPGKLLLGRVFSLWNLTAYAVAIIMVAMIDHAFRSRWRPRLPLGGTALSYRP